MPSLPIVNSAIALRIAHTHATLRPMTAALAPRQATYQDVLDAPPHQLAEIIDGQLQLHPRPARRHEAAHSLLGTRLTGAFDIDGGDGSSAGGWVIRLEPELHLHANIVVPDLAAWRVERYDVEHEDEPFHSLPPDWCCEILSPTSRAHDRITKPAIYAREGVSYYWVVDPLEKEIEAFERLADGRWALLGVFAGTEGARIAPFDALELPLARIWGR